jgi:hypothetical protein
MGDKNCLSLRNQGRGLTLFFLPSALTTRFTYGSKPQRGPIASHPINENHTLKKEKPFLPNA